MSKRRLAFEVTNVVDLVTLMHKCNVKQIRRLIGEPLDGDIWRVEIEVDGECPEWPNKGGKE